MSRLALSLSTELKTSLGVLKAGKRKLLSVSVPAALAAALLVGD